MSIACPCCGSASSRPQPRHREASLYRCRECGHCFTDPASIAEPETYGAAYYEVEHRNWFAHPDTELFDVIHDLVVARSPTASVIDIGCGRGDLLRHLRRRSPTLDLTGIDLSANEPADGIRFIQGEVSSLPARRYDVVVSCMVIEHIFDTSAFAAQLRSLLRDDGLLIVNTINESGVVYGLARTLRRMGLRGPYERLYSRHHVNHFSVASLETALRRTGLEVCDRIMRNIPLAAVDVGGDGLKAAALKAGVGLAFAVGRATGGTFSQTVVCRPR